MSLNTINVGTINNATKLQPGNATTNGGFQGDQWASELHGRFYTLAKNGLLFMLDSDSVTLAAAHTTKGAAATIKLINGFYNPGPVDAEIIAVVSTWTSGTPTGALVYNAQTQVGPPTSAATGTIRSARINTTAGSTTSFMIPQVNVIFARSDAATTAFTQVGIHGGPAAVAAGAGLYSVIDEVAGRIIVPPLCAWGLAQVGASTAVVQSTIYWAEVAA